MQLLSDLIQTRNLFELKKEMMRYQQQSSDFGLQEAGVLGYK